MEVLVLKNNFKSYKETKRREIRNGFMRLQSILQQREKELMEAVENLEIQKQKALYEFAEYTSKRIDQMDSLMQYSKEALKEQSQLAFLQSAYGLVVEIEDAIANIYQPSPLLREDPIKHLKVNFEELAQKLQTIFPALSKKVYDKTGKFPYPCSSDIMIPRDVSSAHVQNPLGMDRSQSLASFTSLDQDIMNDMYLRPKSLPPNLKDNGMYAIWDAASDTSRSDRRFQNQGIYYNPELHEEAQSTTVPGIVIVYQTLVFPTLAKVRFFYIMFLTHCTCTESICRPRAHPHFHLCHFFLGTGL